MAAGNLPAAILGFEQLLAIDPRNPAILSNLAKLHHRTGNIARALARFGEAYVLAPSDPGIKSNFLACHGIIGNSLVNSGRVAEGIAHYREILAREPDNYHARVNIANALEISGIRAELRDFMPGAAPERLGHHLLIACMPKSGSTFLKEVLCALTGWGEVPLTYAYLQNEQEIYLPNLIRVAAENTITQQHCRATGPNIQILQGFGIRPVVLVRRLEDIVLSLSDFYDAGATMNTFFGEVWPGLDRTGKIELIIDQVMPWYAAFYASWQRVAKLGRLDCLFVSYEEMIADKPGTVSRVAAFLDLGKSAAECAAAVARVDGDAVKTRFNKGVAGRGAAALSDDQKARLRRLVADYGEVDLARLGLAA
jgi:tetratricopeptide (TPR) repeat protein